MEEKYYIKDGDIKSASDIVIVTERYTIVNPTEEQILAHGWVEYAPKPYTPTQEELLEQAKNKKLREIDMYDKSDSVNQFFLNWMPMWLTEPERDQAQKRFERDVKKGLSSTTLYWHDHAITLNPEQGLIMLDQLTEYANSSYDKTMQHRINVKELSTIKNIEDYDYTVGYPVQLEFKS